MLLNRMFSAMAVTAALIAGSAALAQTETPKRGGTLVATWGGMEPQALFVPAGGGSSPTFTATKVLERLVKMERDLSFSPVLALSVTPSADFKTYTVKLRPNVKWNDGKDFTADDVVFSAMDYWKPISVGVAFKSLQSVTVVDKNTVTLNLDSPMAEFALKSRLADWTALVLPKHIYGTGNIITNPANNALVGTGPYKLKTWVRGSYVEFVKNEAYWNPALPYLDKLVIRWWHDPASRSAALEAGELDIAVFNAVPAPDFERLTKTGKFLMDKRGYENASDNTTIEFNTRRPETGKREVRAALMQAINKKFIADTIYYKLAKPAVSTVNSVNNQFFSSDVEKYPFDPVKAGKALDTAGYPVKDGSRFTVNLVVPNWYEVNTRTGQYIKQALEDIKVKVNLTIADRPTALKRIYSDYDYDMAISNEVQAIELVPKTTRYYTTDGIIKGAAFRNATGYSNPVLDKVVDDLAVEPDLAKRKKLATDFQRITVKDAPLLPLVEVESITVVRKDVRNYSNGADYMNDTWGDIWLAR